jgi:hypothetical protein
MFTPTSRLRVMTSRFLVCEKSPPGSRTTGSSGSDLTIAIKCSNHSVKMCGWHAATVQEGYH